MGANRRPFRFLATSRVPLRLATGIAVAGLAWQTSPKPLSADPSLSSSGEKIKSAFDGVVRSSRAIYTITFIIVDYKYYLRSLPPNSSEYRIKLSEVHLRSARRLLRLCEANKGFYVKAGQFVSSLRQVPKEYSSALSSLQDQVHRGVLKDNKEVAIKVQYPGLEQRMKIDITTMDILSKLVSWIFPDYRFERVVSEFERATSLELDFIQEANNSERTARNFKKNNIIKIPHVYWDLTTRHVLTMQFCSGHKVDDLDFLKDSGINPKKVAKALMEVFAEMIFVHGFLHGDPHPGNILVSPEGHHRFSLVLLDHGIYRELDERFRLDYCQLWKALILLDSQKIQHLGERFGVGKYSKYFPVIFTGRTIDSKSALGGQMSNEEKKRLKQELRSLRMEDISSFLESLPDDFLSILRTDGLLRSIISKLGAPRRVRLLAYARYAAYGLGSQSSINSGSRVTYALSQIRTNVSYIQFRILIEILALLSQIEDMRYSLVSSLRRMLHGVVYFLSGTLFFLHS
ncbi:probable serine/threonine-protein kinase abkD isoform X2 [Phoenix dactylifera]|uniref:Probable serine/threonine-protein kinase abkD isoform X2 n=1 Tax=Phoenix dactylifera TaxID=42345 RepID=A0A8B8ZX64_PHODC|nr:probable serine/threonine-protein kinase abkD isoform X2 [Phoenix dactylifera]